MSMDSTVVKKNICRKKSDTRPTTAKRQNSCRQDTLISYGSRGDNGKYFNFRKRETQQTPAQSAGLSLFYWQILLSIFCNSSEFGAKKVHVRIQEHIYSDSHSLFFLAIKHQSTIGKNSRGCFPSSQSCGRAAARALSLLPMRSNHKAKQPPTVTVSCTLPINLSPNLKFLQEQRLLRNRINHSPTKDRTLKSLYICVLVCSHSPGPRLNHFCLNHTFG